MRKMSRGTILYVGNFRLPDKGAAANRVVNNGKLFQKCGYKTVFLGLTSDRFDGGLRQVTGHSNMYEESAPSGIDEWIRHIMSTENIHKIVKLYPDISMIILYNSPFSLLFCVKKFFPNSKAIYDCTEWTKVTDGSIIKRFIKLLDYYLIRYLAPKTADSLIVVSSRMEKAWSKNRNTVLLPPLVDIKEDKWHQQKSYRNDKFEFVFSGILDNQKERLDYILSEFVSLNNRNCVLRIIGVTKEEFESNYSLKVSSDCANVLFMGFRPHEETLRFVENADCNIVIRVSDQRNNSGFPTKFAEAVTCVRPIITTNVSDISKYTSDKPDIFFLESFEKGQLSRLMRFVCDKAQRGSGNLKDTFHYENYADLCSTWLDKLAI